MKKIGYLALVLLVLVLSGCGTTNKKGYNIKKEKTDPIIEEYIDDNPITVGIYDGHNLIQEYNTKKEVMSDIAVLTVYYTNDLYVDSLNVKHTFNKYFNNYQNINDYKIGYFISYKYDDKIYEKTFLDPSIMYEMPGMYIYLYDEINQDDGAFYSHIEEDDVNENTILDTIKIFLTDELVESPITLMAFTYNGEEDFDKDGNYRGVSKYSIKINLN